MLDVNSNAGNDIIDFTTSFTITLVTSQSASYYFPPISDVTIDGKGTVVICTGSGGFSNLGNNTIIDNFEFGQFNNGVFLCHPGAGGSVTINNASFSINHNTSVISQGGGILQFSGDLYLINNYFWNCTADLGGAICFDLV